jgi:hypothetical protein
VGIYTIRFFIRGKPWHITVDDEVLFYLGNPYFSKTGDNQNLWAPILEKAWSKSVGTYQHANGGFTPNAIKALTGSPTYQYMTADGDND